MKKISKFLVVLFAFAFAFSGIFAMQNFSTPNLSSNAAINETEFLSEDEDNDTDLPNENEGEDENPDNGEGEGEDPDVPEIIYYTLTVQTNVNNQSYTMDVECGNLLTDLNLPIKTGYNFVGFSESNNKADIIDLATYQMPEHDVTLYAIWEKQSFTIIFHSNSNQQIESLKLDYQDLITLPSLNQVSGKNFVGWYTDSNFETQFSETTMPANNIELYARWRDKLALTVDKTTQTQTISENGNKFANFSEIDGFTIEYKIDGKWTTESPTKCGTFDVKITRAEDETYAAFETVIAGGLVITGQEVNLVFYIVILFIFSAIELALLVIVRILKGMKKRMIISALVPVFSFLIPMDQLVLIIVSGILALVFLILLIYEIVSLHNTLPKFAQTEETEVSKVTQSSDKSSDNQIGTKYSAEDIEKMLVNDTYKPNKKEFKTRISENEPYQSATIKAKQKKQQEDNSNNDFADDYVLAKEKNGIKSKTYNFSDTEEIYHNESETFDNKK